ncbi:MAG: hypothetical protein H7Y41_02235 [Hyphomonadaceae bacterium]|nr:hypothetical protein [Clostridia bacterium]
MYVISSFTYSTHLELAISELELKGIKNILAIPLDKPKEKRKLFDTIQQADGISLIDIALIIGTVFMVLGFIYGFVLKWGPIIWGLIGLIGGGFLGFLIDVIPKKMGKRKKNGVENNTTEVVIMVNCDDAQVELVEDILMRNLAIGMGRLDRKPT